MFIQKWHVGLAHKYMQPDGNTSQDQKPVLTWSVVSLQGQASDGSWLSQATKAGVRADTRHYVEEATAGAGFSSLHGWCLTSFMDSPGACGRRWEVSADDLSVPGGRVVGYQMRTWDGVDSIRFLFRPFQEQGELQGQESQESRCIHPANVRG